MDVRIYLAGSLAAEVSGQLAVAEHHFRGRQSRVGFAYLVCHRLRPVPREEMAEVLWPAERPPAWQAAVSAIVSRLQALLSASGLAAQGASISHGFGQYRLFLPPGAWVDLEAAAAAIDAAEGALRAGNFRAAFGPATVTAIITRRPFLSDTDCPWAEAQRSRLQRQLLRALECQAAIWLLNHEPGLALEAAAEALTLDPFRETSAQALMRSYAATGNRAKALQVYRDLRARLAEELGIDPSAETEALYLELLG